MNSTDGHVDAGTLAASAIGDPGCDRVVLVHGFTQNGQSWRHVADALASSYHLITIDLPGHGRSTNIVVNNLTDTAELLGATGGRGTYVGYSLGGRVCLALACAQPDLVERLVLISASPGISDAEERQARARSDAVLADRLDPPDPAVEPLALERFLDEWLAGPLFAQLTAEQADRSVRLTNEPRGLAASLRSGGVGNQVPLHDCLADLAMPVLCIAGGNDTRYTALARTMATAIGDNADVRIVDGAGHAVPFERPEATVELLRDFLEPPATGPPDQPARPVR